MQPQQAPSVKVDNWLARHRRAVLAALLGLALLCRVLVFCELHGGPMFDLYKHNEMDMHFFSQWGGELAADDILGQDPMHPMHTWHIRVAEKHFEKHPLPGVPYQDREKRQRGVAVQKVWDEWYGGNRYHQEPLYAYFLASVIGATAGSDVSYVFALQMLVGVLSIGMLFGLTRRVLGDLVGVVTALIAILWGPLIHYEIILLRTSMIVFFSLAVLYGAQRMRDSGPAMSGVSRWRWFGFGALLGAAAAMKTTLLLLGLGLAMGLVWSRRREAAYLLRTITPMGVGILVSLAPFLLRNVIVGAPIFSLTSVAAVTFAGANTPNYQPAWGWAPFDCLDEIAAVMRASQGSFLAAVTESIALHESFVSYCGLLWEKFLLIWHWFELPNNSNYYYTCSHSVVLGAMRYLVAAWWVIPAGLIGVVLAWRKPGTRAWVWFLVCSVAPLVVFYVLSRFRVPMVVGLMPFAAFAVTQFVDWIWSRRADRWVPTLILFVVMALFMNRGFTLSRPVLGPGNYGFSLDAHYMPKADLAARSNQFDQAAEILEEFVLEMPDSISRLGPGRLPTDVYETRLTFIFQVVHERLAEFYARAGNRSEALRCAAFGKKLAAIVKQAEVIHGKAQKRQ